MDQVLRITFDIGPQETYLPAQNIALYPRNSFAKVQRVLKLLKADPSAVFVPKTKDERKYPNGVTVKSLFLNFMDLNGQIKVSTLKKLAACDLTLNQSQNFQNLLKNKNIRNEYIKKKKNIVDLLEDFKIQLNVNQFVSVCSSIKVTFSKKIISSLDITQFPLFLKEDIENCKLF